MEKGGGCCGGKGPVGTREMNSVIMGEWGVCVCTQVWSWGSSVCVHAMVTGVWGKGCRGGGQGRLGRGHGSMPLGGRRKL